MLGSWCYCSWNRKDQAPPAKIKQATTWRKCSLGDVILTLSLICMTNWVMNAYLLISSAIDIYVSKDKLQIALWNEWEKYSNTGMIFNLWWPFFKMIKSYQILFCGVYNIRAYQIISLWKGSLTKENSLCIHCDFWKFYS